MPLVEQFLALFHDAASFWFWPYLVSGFAFIFGFLLFSKRTGPGGALREIFSRRVWLSKSSFADIILAVCHDTLWIGLIIAGATSLTFQFERWLELASVQAFGYRSGVQLPALVESLAITALIMVAFDFGSYAGHRMLHRWSVLWHFHAVHHSAETLNFVTIHRLHPVDTLVITISRSISVAIAWVGFYSVVQQNASMILVWGMGAGSLIYMFTINLHHSHVPVTYPRWLRWIAISPHIHQLHHSRDPRHQGKNFGVMFSIWDRMFGSYHDEPVELGQLKFGVDDDPYRHSVLRLYLLPPVQAVRSLWFGERGLVGSKSAPTVEKVEVYKTSERDEERVS